MKLCHVSSTQFSPTKASCRTVRQYYKSDRDNNTVHPSYSQIPNLQSYAILSCLGDCVYTTALKTQNRSITTEILQRPQSRSSCFISSNSWCILFVMPMVFFKPFLHLSVHIIQSTIEHCTSRRSSVSQRGKGRKEQCQLKRKGIRAGKI